MRNTLILMLAFALCGCESTEDRIGQGKSKLLPPNTEVIYKLGNGWFVVDIYGARYLYRYLPGSNGGDTEVLAPFSGTLPEELFKRQK